MSMSFFFQNFAALSSLINYTRSYITRASSSRLPRIPKKTSSKVSGKSYNYTAVLLARSSLVDFILNILCRLLKLDVEENSCMVCLLVWLPYKLTDARSTRSISNQECRRRREWWRGKSLLIVSCNNYYKLSVSFFSKFWGCFRNQFL